MSEVLPPGAEIANYRVSRVVGRGGMGVVYLAEHTHLGRMAALKTISGVHAQTPEFRERFVRESRLAAQIDHPNIVPIYDAGESEGLLYLAMRFVDGEDLDRLNEREAPLDAGPVLDVLAQVASALDAAHAQGLVHRDVKPANVLLEPAGPGGRLHAYLADFGLTKHAGAESGLTASGQVVGTLFYVAPEQIQGHEVDGRTDQYSLACMLYESLTGVRPFDSQGELLAILNAHLNSPRPSITAHRPDLPTAIDAAVARALALSPDERFATCEEFLATARAALQHGAAGGGEPGPAVAGGHPEPPAGPSVGGEAERPARAGAETATGVRPPPPRSDAERGQGAGPDGATTGRRRRGPLAAVLGALALVGVVAVAAVLWPAGERADPTDPDDSAPQAAAGQGDEGQESPDDAEPTGEGGSPPSDRLVFSSDRATERAGTYDVFRMQPDGTELVNLTESPGTDDRQATWSRDRERLVFASDRTGEFAIHTMNPDGGDVTPVTSGEGRDLDPRFSPDGERIAFSSQREDSRSIYVINVDGTGLRRLTDDGGEDMRPTWSPDGARLAFHRRHGDDDRIDVFVMEAEPDAEPVNVTDRPARDFHPSWAPAEPLLTFASDQDGDGDIFRVEVTNVVDGAEPGTPRNLTSDREANDGDPNWSPGAEWITFQSNRGGDSDVYIMQADGSGRRRLTDSASSDIGPAW